MKMQLKWFVFMAVVLVLLPVVACGQREGQPEPQLADPCDKLKNYIEQAQVIASELEDFNWDEFSEIGILCPPSGICPVGDLPIVEKSSASGELMTRWIPLTERLPSPQTAGTCSIQCASCLKLAEEVCSSSPYNGAPENIPESEKLTLAQWQELCGRLQSALKGAEYSASRDKDMFSDYIFPQLLSYLNSSDEDVKQKYLDKFVARSDNYIQLHAELISNIQRAQEAATELAE
jgi:hypothetical protein